MENPLDDLVAYFERLERENTEYLREGGEDNDRFCNGYGQALFDLAPRLHAARDAVSLQRQQTLQEAQAAVSGVVGPLWHLETVHEVSRRLRALQGLPENEED